MSAYLLWGDNYPIPCETGLDKNLVVGSGTNPSKSIIKTARTAIFVHQLTYLVLIFRPLRDAPSWQVGKYVPALLVGQHHWMILVYLGHNSYDQSK